MSTRANKHQSTDEERRAKKKEYSKIWKRNDRAKKRAAKEGRVVVQKAPTPKKVVVNAPVPNKIPDTTNEEHECFLEYRRLAGLKTRGKAVKEQDPAKRTLALKYLSAKSRYERQQKKANENPKAAPASRTLPSEVIELNRAASRLRYHGKKDQITPEMRKAERVVANFYANNKKTDTTLPEKKATRGPGKKYLMSALVEKLDDIVDEVFNTNWVPASRRINITINITM